MNVIKELKRQILQKDKELEYFKFIEKKQVTTGSGKLKSIQS